MAYSVLNLVSQLIWKIIAGSPDIPAARQMYFCEHYSPQGDLADNSLIIFVPETVDNRVYFWILV
jgi:hypothetical protein